MGGEKGVCERRREKRGRRINREQCKGEAPYEHRDSLYELHRPAIYRTRKG